MRIRKPDCPSLPKRPPAPRRPAPKPMSADARAAFGRAFLESVLPPPAAAAAIKLAAEKRTVRAAVLNTP